MQNHWIWLRNMQHIQIYAGRRLSYSSTAHSVQLMINTWISWANYSEIVFANQNSQIYAYLILKRINISFKMVYMRTGIISISVQITTLSVTWVVLITYNFDSKSVISFEQFIVFRKHLYFQIYIIN